MSTYLGAVAAIAGLDTPDDAVQPPIPPAQLAQAFACGEPDAIDGGRCWIGFCGYNGSFGFDDGYDFMSGLTRRGWRAIPEKGDWPYVVVVAWHRDGEYALAQYCEADL